VSIFAGIVTRRAGASVPEAHRLALIQALSRHPGEPVQEYRSDRALLAKVDIGAFQAPGWCSTSGGTLSMLAGQPLLACADDRRTRADDLASLHEAWSRGDDSMAARARGVFCAVHYDPGAGRLTLATDKLGIRPIYYWIGHDRVVFATALRILEALDFVPKVADLRGVTELACFGLPLGSRTPYADIQILRSAEVVRILDTKVTRSQYWRWDQIAPSTRPETELILAAHERFMTATSCRLRRDRTTTAFLSGGLDSRSVITALRCSGAQIHTYNFSFAGAQDRVFAAQFAQIARTIHHEATMTPEVELRFSTMLSNALASDSIPADIAPERPRIVWSGDGGSVGAGHVYLTQAMVDLLRTGARDAAVTTYLEQQKAHVPGRLLQPKIGAMLAEMPRQGIAEELDDIRCDDPGRALHLFFLLNDQRRHLGTHFENLDMDRLELQTPFFDSDFLAAVLEIPIDLCLYHGFYMKWLARFPSLATSVPWQTYPGHLPCPLPIPRELLYQWGQQRTPAFDRPRRRQLLRAAAEMLDAPNFPHETLRKGTLRLATWLSRAMLGDYDYILRHASLYYRYCSRSNGRSTLTEAAARG
jgi:hypothetical protein